MFWAMCLRSKFDMDHTSPLTCGTKWLRKPHAHSPIASHLSAATAPSNPQLRPLLSGEGGGPDAPPPRPPGPLHSPVRERASLLLASLPHHGDLQKTLAADSEGRPPRGPDKNLSAGAGELEIGG